MGFLDAIILGLVQGLTEFLPVSSTGHLEVAQAYLGNQEIDHVSLDLFLHLATVAAVLFFFRSDLGEIFRDLFKPSTREKRSSALKLIMLIFIGMIGTAIVFILFKKEFDSVFNADNPHHLDYIGAAFIFTAIVLALASFKKEGNLDEFGIAWWHALLIGVAQGIAITPGISRSGMTICAALLVGMTSIRAFRFSFLLSIPTIILGWLYDLITKGGDLSGLGRWDALLAGSVAAFFAALLAITLLKGAVVRNRLWYFSIYLVPAGIITLLFIEG